MKFFWPHVRACEKFVGKICTISGWGLTEAGPHVTLSNLMIVELEVVGKVRIDGHESNTERVVAASQKGEQGGCTGDSGGTDLIFLLYNILVN